MSVNFSANQYEQAFHPKSLQNWETPNGFGRHPRAKSGSTKIISTDKGHLLPGVPRSRPSPWGTYVGTWDMPLNIPGNTIINHTARADHVIERNYRSKAEGDIVLSGQLKPSKVPDPLPIKADIEASMPIAGIPEMRSGAENPIPQTTSPKPGTPQSVNWPLPANSQCSVRQTPKPSSPYQPVTSPVASNHGDLNQSARTPLIYSPRITDPNMTGAIEWPLPRSVEPDMI